MASVKYRLRNTTSTKNVSINFDIHISGNDRLRGSTKILIVPQYWDQGNQRIRNVTVLSKTKDKLNKKLSKFKSFVDDKIAEYETTNISEIKALLKKDVDIYFGKIEEEVEEVVTLYSFTDEFIKQAKVRVNDTTGKKLSYRTLNDYDRLVNFLKDFEKKHNYEITFDSINLNFYYAFKSYLENLDFSTNTVGKYIKILKVFMNAATEQGFNTNLAFKNKRFVKPTAESHHIYLNLSELEKIVKLDLSNNPKMDNARDLFIIGAFTGLRVSDFNGLSKENIKTYKGKRFFQVIVEKTGKYLPIPLHPEVEKVLKKHNGNPPKKMKSQDINDELTNIGRKAKINEIITTKYIKGGKEITEINKKYKLIKNHTSRRSFCTNAYIAGMPTLDIMAISGHSSERIFLNYIRITADERAIKISENSFFNPKANLNIAKI
jgi:integrase